MKITFFLLVTFNFSVSVTCYMDGNVCAWSCASSNEERLNEVEKLYEEGTGSFHCSSLEGKSIPNSFRDGRSTNIAVKEGESY